MSASQTAEERPAGLASEEEAKVLPSGGAGGSANAPASAEEGSSAASAAPPSFTAPLNPAELYFRNQHLLGRIMDLSEVEASQRLFIIRKYHSGFVAIADSVMDKLQMGALRGGVARTSAALGVGGGVGGGGFGAAGPISTGHNRSGGGLNGGEASPSATAGRADDSIDRYFSVGRSSHHHHNFFASPTAGSTVGASASSPTRGGGARGSSPSLLAADPSLALHASSFTVFANEKGAAAHLFASAQQQQRAARAGSAGRNNHHADPNGTADGDGSYAYSYMDSLLGPQFEEGTDEGQQGGPSASGGVELSVDVSADIKRKDTRLRAMASAFEEERRRAEAFKAAEQRRTEAFARRQQQRRGEQLARHVNGGRPTPSSSSSAVRPQNTHASFIRLQQTREEAAAREALRDKAVATEQRRAMERLSGRAAQEARRRVGIITADAISATRDNFAAASADLRNAAHRHAEAEAARRLGTARRCGDDLHRAKAAEKRFVDVMAAHNTKEAERIERDQFFEHGRLDREGEVGAATTKDNSRSGGSGGGADAASSSSPSRPQQHRTFAADFSVGTVRDVPIAAALARPVVTPRGAVRTTFEPANNRSRTPGGYTAHSSLLSSTTAAERDRATSRSFSRGVGGVGNGKAPIEPINPLTYHRLCGGGSLQQQLRGEDERHRGSLLGGGYASPRPSSSAYASHSLSPAAVLEEAYGNGRRLGDVDAFYYMTRPPQDIVWRR